jgi:hypothetical protein
VLASIRVLNRLELVAETLRAALNELAAAPDWLPGAVPEAWFKRYAGSRHESAQIVRQPESVRNSRVCRPSPLRPACPVMRRQGGRDD